MTKLIELYTERLTNARNRLALAGIAGDHREADLVMEELEDIRERLERLKQELDENKGSA